MPKGGYGVGRLPTRGKPIVVSASEGKPGRKHLPA